MLGGASVAEVAVRYGASKQSIYNWKAWLEQPGLPGLQDRSRRPRHSPQRMRAEVESLVCQLRGEPPRWGARRLVFELGWRGVYPVPVASTIHRALVRNGLVEAQRQRHRRKYKRWQREAPMHLWQMDPVGGIYLADGRELKMLTGLDDHSRFVVIAMLRAVPNGRAVCEAFHPQCVGQPIDRPPRRDGQRAAGIAPDRPQCRASAIWPGNRESRPSAGRLRSSSPGYGRLGPRRHLCG